MGARGRLRLSLRPSPRPRLILTSCTDVVLDTMVDTTDMVLDTMVMDSDTPSTARGLLMLRPIPTFFMEDLDTTDMLDLDTSDTMAMDSDTESMARGLLMLRLSLILTTSPMVMDTPDTSDMDTLDMPDS